MTNSNFIFKKMISLAFFLKLVCLSLKNIFLYLYLYKLATMLIWVLIGYFKRKKERKNNADPFLRSA